MAEKRKSGLLGTALTKIENLGVFVGCVLLWAIVLLIGMQIALREFFLMGLSWVDELARYFHIVLVGAGLAYILRRGANIDVRLVVELLPFSVQRVLGFLTPAVILCSSVFIVLGSIQLIQRAGASRMPALGMEVRYFLLPIAIGFGLLALESARQLIVQFFSPSQVIDKRSGDKGDRT